MIIKFKKILIFVLLFQINSINSSYIRSDITNENEIIDDIKNRLLKLMNFKIDPCKNFLNYACGNYNEYEKSLLKFSSFFAYDEKAYNWLYSMNNYADYYKKSKKFEIQGKEFFKSCLKFHQIKNSKKLEILKNYWPIINDYRNDTLNFDYYFNWTTPLGEFLDYSLYWPILDVYTYKNKILIYPGYYEQILFLNSTDEINEIKLSILELGIDKINTDILTQEIIDFSKELYNIMKNRSNNENWYSIMTYENFYYEFPNISLSRSFHSIFGIKSNFHINDNRLIVINNQIRTFNYLKMINSNKRIAFNYFMWLTLKANRKFPCIYQTFRYFHSIFYKNFYKKSININDIDIYKMILSKTIQTVKQNLNNGKLYLTNNDISLFIENEYSIIDYIINDFGLNTNSFENMTIYPDDFEANRKNLEDFLKKSPCELPIHKCITIDNFGKILLSIANNHNKPFYTTFSTFMPDFMISLSKNEKKSLIDTRIINNYEKCRNTDAEDDDDDQNKTLIQFHNPHLIILTTAALKYSFNEYEKFMKEDIGLLLKNFLNMIGLNYQKLFFINFIQNYCSKNIDEQMYAFEILTNFQEFSKIFNCPINSLMNPKANCYSM